MKHARPEFMPWEQHVTCCHCGKPLDDNRRMKDALTTNTTAGWAKHNLRVLAEMAADHDLPKWYVEEVKRIGMGIQIMPSNADHGTEYDTARKNNEP